VTRALVFTHHFPSAEAPTRAPYSFHTYRALMRHCEMRVVAPIPWWWRTRTPRLIVSPLRESTSGIDAVFASYWSIPRLWPLHGVAVAASMAPLVRKIRREFPFDVILAAWAYPDSVAAAHLAKLFDVPLLVTVLGSDVNESGQHFALRPQIARALRSAARVVSVSHALGDRVAEMGVERRRIAVVQNGVDGEAFAIRDARAARAKLGLPQDRPIVTFVGNLLPVKGVDVLVEAVGRLRAMDAPPIFVCMVGGGSLADDLKARASVLGVADRIHFAGRCLPTEVPAHMNACDVFCLPSREEGCPNVVLEALASGKPVVASRTGGIPELVRAENGILVPTEDPDALASALVAAVKGTWDPEALRRSVPSLSWSEVGDTYARLIDEMLAERPA
jgi:glycosyltransferase involved in cell wall biosynthesis